MDVIFYRLHFNAQLNGDLFIAEAPFYQRNDLPFPPRKGRFIFCTRSVIVICECGDSREQHVDDPRRTERFSSRKRRNSPDQVVG